MSTPIKVMIVDDSALVRKVLGEIIDADPGLQVVAQAADPLFAEAKLASAAPDVIVLDIEMPRMDGLTFLQKLMREHPLPVVMCSSFTERGADATLDAMRYGAVEIITKPRVGTRDFLQESATLITDAIKAASRVKVRARQTVHTAPKLSADVVLPPSTRTTTQSTEKIIAIGASTGGTEALRAVLGVMPANSPGIVIVQHMPAQFTTSFANSLNRICAMEVCEAQNGDQLAPGRVLLAPGGRHMLLKRVGARYEVEVIDGPLVSRHRPSVDVLFRSTARYAGANAVGCLMTGMGDDGAAGLLEMRQAGARTFAQDEASSVVYGMPYEAWRRGAVEAQVALHDIPRILLQACAGQRDRT